MLELLPLRALASSMPPKNELRSAACQADVRLGLQRTEFTLAGEDAYVGFIDGDDGSPTGRRWVRNPRDESRYLPDTAADNGEWVAWRLPNGTRAFALRERIDHTRRANACGLYWPALACGPVGDLSLDDWFERLPSLREATLKRPRIEAAEGSS